MVGSYDNPITIFSQAEFNRGSTVRRTNRRDQDPPQRLRRWICQWKE
jgi:hypothetical protein